MAIFLENNENRLAAGFFASRPSLLLVAGGSAPRPPSPVYDMRDLHQFVQHVAKLRRFSNRKILTFNLSPSS